MSRLQKFTAYLSFRDTRTCNYFYLQSQELTTCFFLHRIDPYNWTGTNAVLSGKKMWKVKYERLLQKGLSLLCIQSQEIFRLPLNILYMSVSKCPIVSEPGCNVKFPFFVQGSEKHFPICQMSLRVFFQAPLQIPKVPLNM